MRLSLLLVIAALPALSACVFDPEPDADAGLQPGDALPQFSVELSDGSSLSSDELSTGRSVIAFFNTSCSDCRNELPRLEAEYRAAGSEVTYVCIAREETAASIAAFWEDNNLSMPWSPQADRSVYSLFARSGIPRIYRVSDGHITSVSQGLGEDDRQTD